MTDDIWRRIAETTAPYKDDQKMTKKELVQLATKDCERSDCVLSYQGRQGVGYGAGPFYDKCGNETAEPETTFTDHFRCIACGRNLQA